MVIEDKISGFVNDHYWKGLHIPDRPVESRMNKKNEFLHC